MENQIFTGVDGSRALELDERVCPACELPHCGRQDVCGLCRDQGRNAPVAVLRAEIQAEAAQCRHCAGDRASLHHPACVRRAEIQAETWEPMQARFASRCPTCQAEIRKGDSIGYLRSAREARHDRCVPRVAPGPAPLALQRAEVKPLVSGAIPDGAINIMDLISPPIETPRAYVPAPITENSRDSENRPIPILRAAVPPEGGYWVTIQGRASAVGRVIPDAMRGFWRIAGRVGNVNAHDSAEKAASELVGPGHGEPRIILSGGPSVMGARGFNGRPIAPAATPQQIAQRVIAQPRTASQAANQAGAPLRSRTTGEWAIVGDGEAIGCVVLWAPLEGRSTTVGKLADAWSEAQLPAEWLLSGASDVAALGKAVSTAGNRGGLIARSVEGLRGTWQVEAPVGHAQVGQSSRTLSLRVSLAPGGGLRFEPENHSLAPSITRDYETIRNGAVSTSEIRNWLDSMVYRKLLGSGFGAHRGAYFVPGAAEKTFKRIHSAIVAALGGHDPLTALPVGPSDQVKARVIDSLADDARNVLAECREKTMPGGVKIDVGVTSARSAIDKLTEAGERLRGYEALIGPQAELRGSLETLARALGAYARDSKGRYHNSDEAARLAGVWSELEREESRGE